MFNNLRELIATMPDEKACREYLIKERWNGVIICPHCLHDRVYVIEGGKKFKCASNKCYKKFSVTVGTVFECSNIPLTKWLTALYLSTAHKKGISSYQLGKDIGVAQNTAWFMLHRLRELMKVKTAEDPLQGIVEVDETYMSRKYRSDYKGISPEEIDYNLQSTQKSKGIVFGMAERGGKVRMKAIPDAKAATVWNEITENIKPVSELHTDEAFIYRQDEQPYNRESVNHSKHEWVRGNVHTNTVENFWSCMKRGVYGIYHQISYKHLQRYCDEYSYRYNNRKLTDAKRFEQSLTQMEGRLTYEKLTGKKQ